MTRWTYEGKEIKSHEDLDPLCTDIVYCIYYTNGQMYFGKKRVRAMRRLKPTKAQLAIRKNYVRKEIKDLPFLDYVGSSKETEGLEIAAKEIIYQCSTKQTATYLEAMLLFDVNALIDPLYVNSNILGSFFDSALNGLIEKPVPQVEEEKLDLDQ
jgi:hypothetical protein